MIIIPPSVFSGPPISGRGLAYGRGGGGGSEPPGDDAQDQMFREAMYFGLFALALAFVIYMLMWRTEQRQAIPVSVERAHIERGSKGRTYVRLWIKNAQGAVWESTDTLYQTECPKVHYHTVKNVWYIRSQTPFQRLLGTEYTYTRGLQVFCAQ